MPFGTLRWPIVFVTALLLAGGTPRTVLASPISAEGSTFGGGFRAFVADFSRWDTAHHDLPLMLLALTPKQQRPEMLFLLWYLWMHDHLSTATSTFNLPSLVSLAGASQPRVSGIPGGGTTSSNSGSQDTGGGKGGGSGHSAPEPSSLILATCGSLGLMVYRLVRARAGRDR